jgi:predicted transposase YbfD/YdcC
MLKDRRVLLETELAKAQAKAAKMYLDIVINDRDVHSHEYQVLKDIIGNLQFDLNLVNGLIKEGHE